ncbi:hypothetical protein B566_EDAN011149 [Ephemera danica]|nr:hypothetical protein B566_EDAN011149 [Ephemera danica]
MLSPVLGLTLLKIQVPPVRMTGEHATLVCEYRLEDAETLYSVKWYKDNEEFYRYVPRSKPANQSYKVEGIKVEVSL